MLFLLFDYILLILSKRLNAPTVENFVTSADALTKDAHTGEKIVTN